MSLIQNTTQGAWQTSAAGVSTLSLATPHYTSNTTAGSILIAVVSAIDPNNTTIVINNMTFTTSGFTWVAGTLGTDPTGLSGVRVFYIVGAASMSSATLSTGTVTVAGGTATGLILNIDMYEFSAGQLVDAVGGSGQAGPTAPSAVMAPLYSQELVFLAAAAYSTSGSQGNLTAGSGFTNGNATFISNAFGGGTTYTMNCQQQYELSSASAGSQTFAFGSNWRVWASSGVTFIINAGVTVTSSTPSSGTTAGGTAITNLAGTGFAATPTVTFGGGSATSVVFSSSTKLTCTTPAHAAGLVAVTVTNPDGQFGTGNVYTYTGGSTLRLLNLLGAGT